ncbi:hypothetical protein LCP9604111_3306 [Penicillium roqueforti]|uniref:uncharacterized protein n=1 Tax=Penicillium roqueforti TaxID=5082 RepID=UPI0019091FA2|nr:uncharacterized protein LCP9604111_3306 [Penicillium roqueforti]KAF9250404.1 hypothetical protein LCP9604111_3306 [Penicillium roqueforti]KAI2716336.1 hypothetical protein CBS147318_5450 [Penicillium roqueforti]KAI3162574.1 hypothetical protein DTO039G3_7957 [Penicillium roqueforti]
MAEAIGLASGVLALATFAFRCSVSLYETVNGFRSHPKRVRDLLAELEALSAVLAPLVDLVKSNFSVDLSCLDLPLLRCGNVCQEFQQEILKCASRSDSTGTSFRDWARLTYMGNNIVDFRDLLAGYKATINIALTDVNLRLSAGAVENIGDYESLIQDAKDDLGARLESIDRKLEELAKNDVTQSGPDAAELHSLREERLSTEKCLQICAQLSNHIDQIQLMSDDAGPSLGSAGSEASPATVTNEGLQECKNSLAMTANKLEKHMRAIMDRLVAKSRTAISSDEDAQDLSRLRDEWETTRQCLEICSRADDHLKENVSIIENHGTGDALQFMVSANGQILHGKNRGLGWRSRQVGGYMSNESIQQLSRDLTAIHSSRPRDEVPMSKEGSALDKGGMVEGEMTREFEEQYGRGFALTPARTPEAQIPSCSASN